MSPRIALIVVVSTVLALLLSSCGGGSGSGGGGGDQGGDGGGAGLSISLLAPSSVAVGVSQGDVTIYGQGFTQQSLVLIDGQQAPLTTYTDSGTLQAEIIPSFTATAGTHQISVQNSGQVSNLLPFTIYAMQQGPFVMQAIPGFLVGENESDPTFVVAADVNGDGLADVIMPGPVSIAILDGQQNGTLAAAQYVPVPNTPYALAVGDVNGDGTPDLISISSDNDSTTTVSLLLGDGHGNFQPPATQQTFSGIYPANAYLSDLDGDGKPDLILAVQGALQSSTGGTLVWLKNIGGAFAAPVTLASYPGNYRDFSIADFNHDGKPDILYVATNTTLHILTNKGNGSFSDEAAGGLSGISGSLVYATVIDFNLDGTPDLIVQTQQGNGGILYSFAGAGNGSFTQVASLSTPGPITLAAGDFDHDGFPDLAGPSGTEPSEILYFFGDGHGNFTMQQVVGPEGDMVAIGDFNGDGIPDVVVPDRFNFVSLALGQKGRNFPSPFALYPATMNGLSTGDITGNGLQDIFVGGNFIDVLIPGTVFQNVGNGTFQDAASTDPYSFAVADLTGNGVVDLLGGNTNLEIWPNNVTFGFSSSPITFTQPTSDVTVADMDKDGHPDIVSASGQIFYGNGAYQFTPVNVSGISAPYVIGDFNGDGLPDIATGSGTLLNTGNRTFQEVSSNNLPLIEGTITAVADFNGDGKDDIAISFSGANSVSIYYSRGDGTFYQGTVIDPGQEPGALVAGDFNGDGKADLAVGLMLSQQACMFFNSGNGQFTRSFFAPGADVVSMVASDLNHNGKLDLVIGNFVLDFEPPNVNVVFHQ
jgi:FG-GAP-like repeat